MDESVWNELNISSGREQAEAALSEMAGILRGFFVSLRDKGFTEQEALFLVNQYMLALVSSRK